MDLKQKIREINSELKSIDSELSRLKTRKSELLKTKQNLINKQTEEKAEALAKSHDWESDQKFPWSEKVKKLLHENFKLTNFRPLQLSAINASLSGNDVFVIMPTG